MSEVQENSVLSSQSADTIDSLEQDANGDPVMSKSKARSLRRKRAKQRKKATEIQEEKKVESQDKENDVAPFAQESQVTKKKKKPRKQKNKTKEVEEPKKSVVNNNSTETPSLAAAPKDIPDVKIDVEKQESENTIKTELKSSVKIISPVKKEPVAQVVDDLVATPVDTTSVEGSKPNVVPTTVYEDDNENKEGTKEDCACACVIS